MLKEKLISWLGAWAIRVVGWTVRLRIADDAGFLSGTRKAPLIFAYWHNRMLFVPMVYLRHYRGRKGAVVLISQNRDAQLIADVVAHFGIRSVYGSSSRGGAPALLKLAGCINDGLDVNITPDGPRGPVYKVGSGLIFLAEKTGAPIVPLHVECSRCIRFNSWDRFMVPLPFSRVDFTFGKLEYVAPIHSKEAFETERLRIEKVLRPVTL